MSQCEICGQEKPKGELAAEISILCCLDCYGEWDRNSLIANAVFGRKVRPVVMNAPRGTEPAFWEELSTALAQEVDWPEVEAVYHVLNAIAAALKEG